MEMSDNVPTRDVVGGLAPEPRPLRFTLGDRSLEFVERYGLSFKLKPVLLNQGTRREDRVIDCTLIVTSFVETLELVPLYPRVASSTVWTHHSLPARKRFFFPHIRDVGVGQDWSLLEREWYSDLTRQFGALIPPDRIVGQVGAHLTVNKEMFLARIV